MIAIHPGECKPHKFQDEKYGKGFRVMTVAMKEGKVLGARCTVCGPSKKKGEKRGGIFAINDLQKK